MKAETLIEEYKREFARVKGVELKQTIRFDAKLNMICDPWSEYSIEEFKEYLEGMKARPSYVD